jgi:hypothetical protein
MEFELARDFFKTPPGPPPKTPPALPLSWQPLATGLSGCLEDYDQQNQDSQSSQAGNAPTDYQSWLDTLFPSYTTAPLADHHHQLWQWVWSLKRGTRQPPIVCIWPRGGAKSTSVELACVAVGARDARRYILYVSGTQSQADDHVQNVGAMLESAPVAAQYPALSERSVGKYGSSKGWRRNRLRTQAGLTVDALGLDVAARGVKLDEQRPDLIVFDDIDDTSDSADTVRKKITAITQKILPAGSSDVAVMFVQNLVHYEGVAARLAGVASEPADFLADRVVSGPLPALKGFVVEKAADGKWLITSGTPIWDGQNVETCQRQIYDWGIKAFRAEAQHERTPPEGQAFPEWDVSVHVCEPFPIPDNWPRWTETDYGYAAPYATVWLTRSPSGRIYQYREDYGAGYAPLEQAQRIRTLSQGERYFLMGGDPAMWASSREGKWIKSVAAQYAEMGVQLTKADNDRMAGWARFHGVLDWSEQVPPTFQVFSTCTNTIRTLPLLVRDNNKPEDVDTTGDDHLADCIRYGLMHAHWLDRKQGRTTRRMVAR